MVNKRNRILYKKLVALCVAGVLSLTAAGCSGSSEVMSDGSGGAVEQAGDVEGEQLTPDSVVVSVGDEKATYRELQVYMYILKAKYQDVFGSQVWDYKLDNEHTMSEIATEQVINMITEMKVISRQASELGIELSGDEREDIRRFAKSLYDKASEEDVKKYYLDIETITNVYCENEIANKVYDSCITGIADSISENDAKQITVQYIFVRDDGSKKKLKEVKAMRKGAKAARDFLAYAQSHTEGEETQVTFGPGEMGEEFTTAAMSLKAGQISDVVKASDGYYIIYCVNDNENELTLQKKEQMIADAQKANFEKQYNEWAANYQVEVSPLIL